MNVSSNNPFIKFILTPGWGFSKHRKAGKALSIGISCASFGIIPLICLILNGRSQKSSKELSLKDNQEKETEKKTDIVSKKIWDPKVVEYYDFSGKRWITNGDLHYFLTLICIHFENVLIQESRLITTEIMHEEITLVLGNVDKEEICPFFINVGNHYTLVLIDNTKQTVEYYDSKGKFGNYKSIKSQLENIAQSLSYQFVHKTNKRLQPDSYQCGVWAMYFLQQRIEDPDFDPDTIEFEPAQAMIAEFRMHVNERLLNMHHVYKEILAAKEEKHGTKRWKERLKVLTENWTKDTRAKIHLLRKRKEEL